MRHKTDGTIENQTLTILNWGDLTYSYRAKVMRPESASLYLATMFSSTCGLSALAMRSAASSDPVPTQVGEVGGVNPQLFIDGCLSEKGVESVVARVPKPLRS